MSRYTNIPEYSPATNYMKAPHSDRSEKADMTIRMACKILEIEDDMNKLKDSFATLNTIVTNQQNNIETLENSIINSKENIKAAEKEIKVAESYSFRSYLWYFGGLALGGLAYLGYDLSTKK
jgi:septal ring factor EnvC (AmiA/AmiB activator)